MKQKVYILAALCLVVGVLIGYAGDRLLVSQSNKHAFSEQRMSWYKNGQLTNPLLECMEAPESLGIGDRVAIEKNVTDYIAWAKDMRMISEAAVYFRDLNNGPWFGINERKPYTPGSLLKLPIAMGYYRKADFDRHYLDEQIEYLGSDAARAVEPEFDSDTPLPTGVYSLHDLIEIMLIDSSNDAADVLAEYAGDAQVSLVFTDLGIQEPSRGSDYEIDVKTFGAFFRVLFNASYLSQRSSEELLTILTQVRFRDGLVAGVPPSVQVAHKFGTRVTDDPEASRQLHDCGIVYVPQSPYILCIMARGDSAKNLSHFISEVSRKVYVGVTK